MQTIIRMFYRSFTVSMLFLIWDDKAIYGVPFGLIIGILSEYKTLTYKKEKEYLIIDAGKFDNRIPMADIIELEEFNTKYKLWERPAILYKGTHEQCHMRYNEYKLFKVILN
jgi:hypothetical protein